MPVPKECSMCGNILSSKTALNKHVLKCKGNMNSSKKNKVKLIKKTKDEYISKCGEKFGSKSTFYRHNKTCETCNPKTVLSNNNNNNNKSINISNPIVQRDMINIGNQTNNNQVAITLNSFSKAPCLADLDKKNVKKAFENGRWTKDMTREIYVNTKKFCNILIPHPYKDIVLLYQAGTLDFRSTSIEALTDVLGNLVDVGNEYLQQNPGSISEIYELQHIKMADKIIRNDPKTLAENRLEIKDTLIANRNIIQSNYKEITGKDMKC